MNRDAFLDILKRQYSDEISFTYSKHDHHTGSGLDILKLDEELAKLRRSAEVEGLPAEEFDGLVRSKLAHVHDKLTYSQMKKLAA